MISALRETATMRLVGGGLVPIEDWNRSIPSQIVVPD
jgi:hypothetical protein